MSIKKLTIGLLFFFACFILILTIYGALHSWPAVEDLELSIQSRDSGLWRSLINVSNTHDGRYSANLLHASNFLALNKVFWSKYIVLSTIILLFLSVYSFVKVFFSKSNAYFQLLITIIFIALVFTTTPSLYFGLFLIASSYVYFYPCIILPLLSVVAYKHFKSSKKNRFLTFLLFAILLIVGIGFSEIFLLFYLSTAFFLLLYFWFYNRPLFTNSIPLFLVILISVIFFATSPGAFSMDSGENFSLSFLIVAFKVYLIYFKKYILTWSVFLIFFISSFFYHENNLKLKSKVHYIGALLIFICLPYIMTLPFYFANPNFQTLAERIYVPISFIQISILTFIIFPNTWALIYKKINNRYLKKFNLAVYSCSLVLLFIVSLSIYNGSGSAGLLYIETRTNKIRDFNEFMQARYKKLANASLSLDKYKLVCLEELNDFPISLHRFQDLQNNRRYSKWNRYIEGYFNIDEVRIYDRQVNKFDN